jgi:hypothetical protein
MKKAYNIEWIRNISIQQAADSWFNKKMLSQEQYDLVKTNFPDLFYNPGIFVKIGLFIFALLACSFFTGFLSIFVMGAYGGDGAFSILSVISALAFFAVVEFLIKDRKLFHSGVDNALLYAGLGALMVPFFVLYNSPPVWLSCIYALVIFIPAYLRYADILTAITIFLIALVLLANLMMKLPLGVALLPFGLMIFAAVSYLINKRIHSDYYARCQMLFSALSLITFYLGGNYYIVRQGNAILNDIAVTIAPQIPFSSIFYFLTLSIPILYIVFGLRKKNRIMLWIGLFAFAFSVFTYRYYFSFLPIEQGLTLSGLLLILLSAFVISFLKSPKAGLTDEILSKRKLANLEALMAAQHLGSVPQERGIEFGGGNMGGGGAGDTY